MDMYMQQCKFHVKLTFYISVVPRLESQKVIQAKQQ